MSRVVKISNQKKTINYDKFMVLATENRRKTRVKDLPKSTYDRFFFNLAAQNFMLIL